MSSDSNRTLQEETDMKTVEESCSKISKGAQVCIADSAIAKDFNGSLKTSMA